MTARTWDLEIAGVPGMILLHATTEDDAERQARAYVWRVCPGAAFTLIEVKPW